MCLSFANFILFLFFSFFFSTSASSAVSTVTATGTGAHEWNNLALNVIRRYVRSMGRRCMLLEATPDTEIL